MIKAKLVEIRLVMYLILEAINYYYYYIAPFAEPCMTYQMVYN